MFLQHYYPSFPLCGLACIPSAGSRVVHTFALTVHPAVTFRAGLFGGAALVGDFACTFFLCSCSSCRIVVFGVAFGMRRIGVRYKA